MKLERKRAIVTGSSLGFGFAVARAFLQEGANVLVCGRAPETLAEAERKLAPLGASGSRVCAVRADVSKPDDARRVVETTVAEFGGLDILVCNAGVYGPKGPVEDVDWEQWSHSVAINLLGTVLPCREALPHLKRQRHGKIIVVSGGGATKPLPFLSAYAASKAAVVRLAETLADEVREFRIDVNAVAPGALNTRLLDEVLEAGPEKVGSAFYAQSVKQREDGGTPLERGAALCVYLASTASDGITGKLISAVWDPWEQFATFIDDLGQSDIYTLRRIVPQDRGKSWG